MKLKAIRKAVFYAIFATSALAYADPPVNTPGGGVNCNPPCGGMACGPNSCVVCNSDGCARLPIYPTQH